MENRRARYFDEEEKARYEDNTLKITISRKDPRL